MKTFGTGRFARRIFGAFAFVAALSLLSALISIPSAGAQTSNPAEPVISGASWSVTVAADCTASVTISEWDATALQTLIDSVGTAFPVAVVEAGPLAQAAIWSDDLATATGTYTQTMEGVALGDASGNGAWTASTATVVPQLLTVVPDQSVATGTYTAGCAYPSLTASIDATTCEVTVDAGGLPAAYTGGLLFHTTPEIVSDTDDQPDVPLTNNGDGTYSWAGILPHLSGLPSETVTITLTTMESISVTAARGTELAEVSIVVPVSGCVAESFSAATEILTGAVMDVTINADCTATATVSGWNADRLAQVEAYYGDSVAATGAADALVGPTAYHQITFGELMAAPIDPGTGQASVTFTLDGPVLADSSGGGTWSLISVVPAANIQVAQYDRDATIATGTYTGGCGYPTMTASITDSCAVRLVVTGMPPTPEALFLVTDDRDNPLLVAEASTSVLALGLTPLGDGSYVGDIPLDKAHLAAIANSTATIELHGAGLRKVRVPELGVGGLILTTDVAIPSTGCATATRATVGTTTTAKPGAATLARTGRTTAPTILGSAVMALGLAFLAASEQLRRRHRAG